MLLLLLLARILMVHGDERPMTVQMPLGAVEGIDEEFLGKRVHSFLSVPFAEPPIGEGRFRRPKVKKAWKGTLKTTTLSPACYQPRDTYNTSFWGSEMWNHNTPVSEDCLYLNIWTPGNNTTNHTVMVWIYGGGFYYGSPSLILYDGKALAVTGDVIVVNINYRVGAFGFLYYDHDEVPGNVGMLDQQLALNWIKDNIYYFGGNPDRITLFGESAGASSIVAHMIAPGSRDLFSNGILQSGALDNMWAMDTPRRAKNKSLSLANLIGDTIKCMRDVDPRQLIDNIWSVDGLRFLEFPFVIVSQDRNFFRHKDAFVALHEGDFRPDINIMIGINRDEGNFWNIYNFKDLFDKAEQPLLTREQFHNCVDTAFAAMPLVVRNAAKYTYSEPNCTGGNDTPMKFYAEQVNQMVGDYYFTCDSLWMADKLNERRNGAAKHGKVYIYHFNQESPANPWPKWTGIMHAYEIEFVFGVPLYNETAGYDGRDRNFTRKIIEYWTSFASTGVPKLQRNRSNANAWPAYGSAKKQWMSLKEGSHSRSIPAMKQVECSLWRHEKDSEYSAYLVEKQKASLSSSPSLNSFIFTAIALFIFR